MSRARNLKPGFFKNEELAECSPWCRLCFAGLWTLADREGRLEDRPKRIKAELFPFDAFDVNPLLDELAERGFILRYEADGDRFIQVLQFRKHQAPHYSEKPSVIKPPHFPNSSGIADASSAAHSRSPPGNSQTHADGNYPASSASDSATAPGKDTSLRGVRNLLTPSSLNPSSPTPSSSTPLSPNPEPKGAPGSHAREAPPSDEPTRAGALCRALKSAGIGNVSPSHPTLLALLAAGATEAEFIAAAPKAAGKADAFRYVLSVVEGQRRDAKAMAEEVHIGPMPGTPESKAWHETAGGVKAKGAEMGIPYTSEDECKPWPDYARRVLRAVAQHQQEHAA